MDLLSFIAEIIKAIAWPAGLVAIILILRRPIIERLKNIRALNYKGVQVDFGKDLDSVKQDATSRLPATGTTPDETVERIKALASLSPRGAVLEAWIEVEAALKSAAGRHGLIDDKINPFDINHVVFQLEVGAHIGKGAVHMFDGLRRLRNKAVHMEEFSISTREAEDFVQIASRIKKILEEA